MKHYAYQNPTLAEVLDTLPVSAEVRAFVESEPDPAAKARMVNALRRDPGLDVAQLESVRVVAPQRRRTPSQQEVDITENWLRSATGVPISWALLQMMRHRKQPHNPDAGHYWPFGPDVKPEHESLYDYVEGDAGFLRVWGRLRDWFLQTHPALESYTLEHAIEASEAWHDELAKSSGLGDYDGSQETVFDYPDGWHMVTVVSQHDHTTEGSKMGHCVGGYYGYGSTILSLRDPDNEPHVTIELRDGKVVQIQGKGDRPPVAQYVPYVKLFFEANPTSWANVDESAVERIENAGPAWHGESRLQETLEDVLLRDEIDKYGLKTHGNVDRSDAEDVLELLRKKCPYRNGTYRAGIASVVGYWAFAQDQLRTAHLSWDTLSAAAEDAKGNALTNLGYIWKLMRGEQEAAFNYFDPHYSCGERPDEDDAEALEKWDECAHNAELEWLREGWYGFYEAALEGYCEAARGAGVTGVPQT